MSVPSNPTVADVVTEGLRRGGRVNPSSTDITNSTNIHFQEVKSDLYLKAKQHWSLLTQSCVGTTRGISRYTWPTACEMIRSIQLIDAPTDGYWRGTATAGGAATITVSASFNQSEDPLIGRFIFITSGTGARQFAQITGYNNTTKVVTIEANWATLDSTWVTPDSTSVYLIESMRYKLWDYGKPVDWDTIHTPFTQCMPSVATVVNRQVWLDSAPDQVYVLLYDYWMALDQLDEVGTPLLNHLRKFRNVWTQGVAVKVMQRYDEDRYNNEINIYNAMLDMYGADAANVTQTVFKDV